MDIHERKQMTCQFTRKLWNKFMSSVIHFSVQKYLHYLYPILLICLHVNYQNFFWPKYFSHEKLFVIILKVIRSVDSVNLLIYVSLSTGILYVNVF